ncbi:MAG: hypothetical protein AAGI69_00490 [Cyanobacteria bacterium P01_H01_bin.21]
MAYQGFIDPSFEHLEEFIRAILTNVASAQTRLALWLIEEFDFSQFSAVRLGSNSPFGSSQLAGFGYLMPIERNAMDALAKVLTDEEQLDCNIMHLEIAVAGKVAIAAYDTFNCVFFNPPITLDFLADLKRQGIIDKYGLIQE